MAISVRQAQAARMFVLGSTIDEISAKVKRSVFTVGEWFRDEEVLARVDELKTKLEHPEKVKTRGLEIKAAEVLRQALYDEDTPPGLRVRLAMYFLKTGTKDLSDGEDSDNGTVGVSSGFSAEELAKLAGEE